MERLGVPLKELVPQAIERHRGNPGHPVSTRITWLSENIETEKFWLALNHHVAEDHAATRHSVGGIFTGKYGRLRLGGITWLQLFSSLDHFLKEFDMRATEFLFRDFWPSHPYPRLERVIGTTRILALNKYPRLRRLFWDDYAAVLGGSVFWTSLATDLASLQKPVTVNSFFITTPVHEQNTLKDKQPKLALNKNFRNLFSQPPYRLGKRARFIGYQNLTQMIKDTFHQDVRTFLLNFVPFSKDPSLIRLVTETQSLLKNKILPIQPPGEPLPIISLPNLHRIVENKQFWVDFLSDLKNYQDSEKVTPQLSYFLRYYSRDDRSIIAGRLGTYAPLATAYVRRATSDLRETLIEPSRKLSDYFMWRFKPSPETASLVEEAKSVCSKLFPHDCLYVGLQTSNFWDKFKKDLQQPLQREGLISFLRNFNQDHQILTPDYHNLYRYAYRHQKEFLHFLRDRSVQGAVQDYQQGLKLLFWHLAPEDVRETLWETFPSDYQPKEKQKKQEESRLLSEAKSAISRLRATKSQTLSLQLASREEAKKYRDKLWLAARSQGITITTGLNQDNILTIKVGPRMKFSYQERPDFEYQVKQLRLQGLENKQIAEQLGVSDHNIEWVIHKLLARREVYARRRC